MKRYANPVLGLYREATEEARKKISLMIRYHKAKSVDLVFSNELSLHGVTYDTSILSIELRDQTDLYVVQKDEDDKIVKLPLKAFIGHDVIAIYDYLWRFENKVKFY